MKWLVIGLFVFAAALFAVGRWTRIRGRSEDERAGSDMPYLLAAIVLGLDVLLLAGWGAVHLLLG